MASMFYGNFSLLWTEPLSAAAAAAAHLQPRHKERNASLAGLHLSSFSKNLFCAAV